MPRTTLLSTLALALACICGGTTLGAQNVNSEITADSSLRVRMLPAQRVTASQGKATREGVLALMEENRRLAAELRRQDEKVETLTRRLAYLKGPVTDSVNRDIARFDAQTAETRARRMALEARLAEIDGTTASTAP